MTGRQPTDVPSRYCRCTDNASCSRPSHSNAVSRIAASYELPVMHQFMHDHREPARVGPVYVVADVEFAIVVGRLAGTRHRLAGYDQNHRQLVGHRFRRKRAQNEHQFDQCALQYNLPCLLHPFALDAVSAISRRFRKASHSCCWLHSGESFCQKALREAVNPRRRSPQSRRALKCPKDKPQGVTDGLRIGNGRRRKQRT